MPSSNRFRAPRSLRLIIILALGACSLLPHQAQAGQASGLTVTLAADKAVYTPGERITLTLRLVNHTSKPVRLGFRTAQRFDLIVQDGQGREVWRWSAGRLFAQVLGQETLSASGGEFVAREAVGGTFPPGTYTVKGIIPAQEGALSVRTTVTIR